MRWPWGRKSPSERIVELRRLIESENLAIEAIKAKLEESIKLHESRIRMHEHDILFVKTHADTDLKMANIRAAKRLIDLGGQDLVLAVEHAIDQESIALRLSREIEIATSRRMKEISSGSVGFKNEVSV